MKKFSIKILKSCEKNICCYCGRCCFALSVSVPVDVNNKEKIFQKKEGTWCPHIVKNKGDFCVFCSLHKHKNHQSLKTCQKWQGSEMRMIEGKTMTSYEFLKFKMREIICHCASEEMLADILQMLNEGRLSDIKSFSFKQKNIEAQHQEYWSFVAFLFSYLNVLKVIPEGLFNFMKVADFMEDIKKSEGFSIIELKKQLNFNNEKPSQEHFIFFEKYF